MLNPDDFKTLKVEKSLVERFDTIIKCVKNAEEYLVENYGIYIEEDSTKIVLIKKDCFKIIKYSNGDFYYFISGSGFVKNRAVTFENKFELNKMLSVFEKELESIFQEDDKCFFDDQN